MKQGATAGRLAGTITARQERRTRTGNKMGILQLSDATGQFEAVLFSETLAQYRDLMEPGRSVVVTVNAENRPEGVSLRVQSMRSLEDEAANVQSTMRIFLRDPEPLAAISRQLGQRGEGQVSLVVIKGDGQGEVEIELPERYRVGPHIASALKAVRGVVDVELV